MKKKLKTETKLYGGGGIAMLLLYIVGIVVEGMDGLLLNAWMILAAALVFTEAADTVERGSRPWMLYAGFFVMAILVKIKQPVLLSVMIAVSAGVIVYQMYRLWKHIGK